MTVSISWPTDLPQGAESQSYSEAPEPNVTAFQPEVGPAKTRRRNSLATYAVSFITLMNTDEVASLLSFWKDTLEDGTQLFNRTHPRLGTTQVFEMTQPPQATYRNFDLYSVQLTLRWYPD